MAVARVFGTVDGVEVIMQYVQGDVWQVPVPLDQDGEYVVEVITEDEAGNRSYLARMLFCVDSGNLCVHIIPDPYHAELLDSLYKASLIPSKFYAELIEPQCTWRGG